MPAEPLPEEIPIAVMTECPASHRRTRSVMFSIVLILCFLIMGFAGYSIWCATQ